MVVPKYVVDVVVAWSEGLLSRLIAKSLKLIVEKRSCLYSKHERKI